MEPYGRSPYVRSNNPGFTTACTHNRGDPSGQPRAISIGTTRAYGCHSQSFNYQFFCTIRLPYTCTCRLKPRHSPAWEQTAGDKIRFLLEGRDGWGRENREFFCYWYFFSQSGICFGDWVSVTLATDNYRGLTASSMKKEAFEVASCKSQCALMYHSCERSRYRDITIQ